MSGEQISGLRRLYGCPRIVTPRCLDECFSSSGMADEQLLEAPGPFPGQEQGIEGQIQEKRVDEAREPPE